jgi:predicted house-cleaning noncanonical NTP pyrophosphatase (MazG superfamily)
MAEQNIESTMKDVVRVLHIQPQQMIMFKQRVGTKLKEELTTFFEKVYEAEMAQLLEALAQQTPTHPVLRSRLGTISRECSEKELNAIRTRATKLEEGRRSTGTQQRSQQLTTPLPLSTPAQPAMPDPQRAAQEETFCNAALSGDLTTLQTFLSQGVNINCAQQGGWTALMNATLQGHGPVVELLIRFGADLNIKDNGGFTALMYAASYRRYAIVEALVKAGANLDIADNGGRTIHQYALSDPQVKEAIQKGQATQKQSGTPSPGTPGVGGYGGGYGTPGYGSVPPAYGSVPPSFAGGGGMSGYGTGFPGSAGSSGTTPGTSGITGAGFVPGSFGYPTGFPR